MMTTASDLGPTLRGVLIEGLDRGIYQRLLSGRRLYARLYVDLYNRLSAKIGDRVHVRLGDRLRDSLEEEG